MKGEASGSVGKTANQTPFEAVKELHHLVPPTAERIEQTATEREKELVHVESVCSRED